MDQVYGNMSLVSHHPAVQGWYICGACGSPLFPNLLSRPPIAIVADPKRLNARPDDCCKGYGYSQNLSAVYKLLRKHDPYHVTTGATECNELQAFQEPYLSLDFPSECTRRLRSGPQTSCVTLACRDSTAQKRKPIL